MSTAWNGTNNVDPYWRESGVPLLATESYSASSQQHRNPETHPAMQSIPPKLKSAFTKEMALANEARRVGHLDRAFAHLERAHVLSQRWTIAHVSSHLGMIRIGWLRRDIREIAGQLARIPAALFFSRIWIPVGNTGGANVSATRPMPLPDDLRALLEEAE